MPSDSELLDDLLQRWEEAALLGAEVSLSELCQNCCHLLPDLQRRVDGLKALRWMAQFQAASGPSEGEPIPGYRLLNKLGQGGCGQVWKARGPDGEPVALKIVDVAGDPPSEWRIVEHLKRFSHPHVLRLLDAWRTEKHIILATELADCSLLDRLCWFQERGLPGIPVGELHDHIREAAAAIDALHANDITHRDIKPSNLLLIGGAVKVADFGLAKVLTGSLTGHTGMLTLSYAAPEYFDGQTTKAGDQYSLAMTYCHLRLGSLLFEGTPAQVIAAHLRRTPDLTKLPREERAAVFRALAKDPKGRWPSCTAFAEAIVRSSHSAPPGDDTDPLPTKGGPIRALLLAFCLGVATGPLWLLVPRSGIEFESGGVSLDANRAGQTGSRIALVAQKDENTHSQPPGITKVNFDGLRVFEFDGRSRILTRVERFAPVTLEAWVYPVAGNPGVQERYIIGSDIPRLSGLGIGMRYNAWSKSRGTWDFEHPPQLLASVVPGRKVRNLYLPMGQLLPHEEWSHVAVVFAEDQTTVYLNGQLVARGVPSASFGGTCFAIGCAGTDNPDAYFKGRIRTVRISKGEVYRREFRCRPQLPADPGTILLYSAGNVKGTQVVDQSGAGNHGILEGVKVVTSEARPSRDE